MKGNKKQYEGKQNPGTTTQHLECAIFNQILLDKQMSKSVNNHQKNSYI